MAAFRIGIGYDVHAFEKGNGLVLGGVKIPFHKKLKGHSDADVLVHAVCDALLGAAALGDLGTHFPDSDENYKDISSLLLLSQVNKMVQDAALHVGNVDAVLIAQKPVMQPHISEMRKNIAEKLHVSESLISVKATTTEYLGFAGREEGIAAVAVALLEQNSRE